MNNQLAGSLLIVAGFIAFSTNAFVAPTGSFSDSYPVNDNWGSSGTLNNTISDEKGVLKVDDTNLMQGFFNSDTFSREGALTVNRVVINPGEIDNDQRISFDLIGLEDGIPKDSVSLNLTDEDVLSVSLEDFPEKTYESYRFDVKLYSEDSSDTPEVQDITVEGRTYQEDALLSKVFMIFMFFLGLGFILKGFTD